MKLQQVISDFARAMQVVDSRRPQARNLRSGKTFHAGIGPHAESAVVALVASELKQMDPPNYSAARVGVKYPGSKQRCDLILGNPSIWAIEVKMARLSGDNGKPDDTSIKDILSPYDVDRSALSDCLKLSTSGFECRKAILIYGFEDARRPLSQIIDAFEALAKLRVTLGTRCSATIGPLVHPVFQIATVFGWKVGGAG